MSKITDFCDFLVQQQPYFDDLILKSIRPSDGWLSHCKFSGPKVYPLRIDVRLLPTRMRRIFLLRYFCGKSFKTIATNVGINQALVRRLYYSAKRIIGGRVERWLCSLLYGADDERRRRTRQFYIDKFRSHFPDLNGKW